MLQKRPMLTNTITGSALWAAGDVLCQKVEDSNTPWDPVRTLRMGAFGSLAGPIYATWYTYLDGFVARRALAAAWQRIGVKVVMDTCLFEPPLLLVTFLALGTMEGKSFAEQKLRLKAEFAHCLAMDCAFWAPAQIINFNLVPLRHQALYVNTLSILWNGYVSYVEHKPLDVEVAQEPLPSNAALLPQLPHLPLLHTAAAAEEEEGKGTASVVLLAQHKHKPPQQRRRREEVLEETAAEQQQPTVVAVGEEELEAG